jgi:hypothetical protein
VSTKRSAQGAVQEERAPGVALRAAEKLPGRQLLRFGQGNAKLRGRGVPPWTERVIVGHGLARDGQEFPVTVTLSGWQDKGVWMLSAEVRRRPAQVAPPPEVAA